MNVPFSRFEWTEDERAEFHAQRARIKEQVKGYEEGEKEKAGRFKKWEEEALEPEKVKKLHEKAMDELEQAGVPVLERADMSFDSLMEEKLSKKGKSWSKLGKKRKRNDDEEADVEEPQESASKKPNQELNVFEGKFIISVYGGSFLDIFFLNYTYRCNRFCE